MNLKIIKSCSKKVYSLQFMYLQITFCNALGKAWVTIVTILCYSLSHGKTCCEYIYLAFQWHQPYTTRMWTQSHEPNSIHVITSMFWQNDLQDILIQQVTLFRSWVNSWGRCALSVAFVLNTKTFLFFFLLHLLCNAIILFLSYILSYAFIDPETFALWQLTLTLGTTVVFLSCLQHRESRSPALI